MQAENNKEGFTVLAVDFKTELYTHLLISVSQHIMLGLHELGISGCRPGLRALLLEE